MKACHKGIILVISIIVTGMCSGCVRPLAVVDVRAPDVWCVFDADCKITVRDKVDEFVVGPTTGRAFLQSRLLPRGQQGTPAEGLYGYLYRLDLSELVGITAIPCIKEMKIDFGPIAKLDYNHDGAQDDVFVVTVGGLGSVGISSASQDNRIVTFTFQQGLCAGSSPGSGQSSFFFGMSSAKPSRSVNVQLKDTLGGTTTVQAQAPQM